jgi:hypothetical protein
VLTYRIAHNNATASAQSKFTLYALCTNPNCGNPASKRKISSDREEQGEQKMEIMSTSAVLTEDSGRPAKRQMRGNAVFAESSDSEGLDGELRTSDLAAHFLELDQAELSAHQDFSASRDSESTSDSDSSTESEVITPRSQGNLYIWPSPGLSPPHLRPSPIVEWRSPTPRQGGRISISERDDLEVEEIEIRYPTTVRAAPVRRQVE